MTSAALGYRRAGSVVCGGHQDAANTQIRQPHCREKRAAGRELRFVLQIRTHGSA
jgi:hypothetical protein